MFKSTPATHVSLVIADDLLDLPTRLCVDMYTSIYTVSLAIAEGIQRFMCTYMYKYGLTLKVLVATIDALGHF